MAQPGIGYRSVYEMMYEMAHHLVSQTSLTSLSSAVSPGLQVINLGSTANLIQGCQVVIDPGLPTEEAIILSEVTSSQIQALFAQSHAAGAVLLGSCFPEQASTDPFFTQNEILGYISRAQNEFLSRVPCSFLLSYGQINFGQILQSLPCNPIELIRVALSPTNVPITSLTRAGGVVTAVTAVAHNLSASGKFSIINSPLGVGSTQFNGAFRVATVISPTSFTYPQAGANDSVGTGGTISLWTRLKETTQEMLTLTNPGWQNDYQSLPQNFYEDRTGLYTYGIDCHPVSNFPTEILCSIRDTDSLGLTDGYLVPDILVHICKYRALQFCWEKDGEQRSLELSKYCNMRWERGIVAALRWLDAMLGAEMMRTSPMRQRAARGQ
jgi:hypothetical protein